MTENMQTKTTLQRISSGFYKMLTDSHFPNMKSARSEKGEEPIPMTSHTSPNRMKYDHVEIPVPYDSAFISVRLLMHIRTHHAYMRMSTRKGGEESVVPLHNLFMCPSLEGTDTGLILRLA